MEKKNRPVTVVLAAVALLLWSLLWSQTAACPAADRSACKDCIVNQMKYGCPTCVPVVRCMAKCLWGGSSKAKCVKRCDCNGGKPTLGECKKCMARCKCSCVS